ncbi:MAG: hypothetical protein ACLPWS_21190 [Rhodomicrobium sp.]
MNEQQHSLEAAREDILVNIENSLAAFFEAEERRIKGRLLRNLNHKESADAQRYVREILFDIRLNASVKISKKIMSLRAKQAGPARGGD